MMIDGIKLPPLIEKQLRHVGTFKEGDRVDFGDTTVFGIQETSARARRWAEELGLVRRELKHKIHGGTPHGFLNKANTNSYYFFRTGKDIS